LAQVNFGSIDHGCAWVCALVALPIRVWSGDRLEAMFLIGTRIPKSAVPTSPVSQSPHFQDAYLCEGVGTMLAPAGDMVLHKDDFIDKSECSDLFGDTESAADDDASTKVAEDGWGWVVEGGSVSNDPAGGTGEGPAAENTDGFVIYDAPFARKPDTEDVASDTGSAPTVYRSEASPKLHSSDIGTPPSPGCSEMPWDSIPSEEATLLPPAATEIAAQVLEPVICGLTTPQIHLKTKPLVPSFWQMDDAKEKRKLEDEPYSCHGCGARSEILTHGEIVSTAYTATKGQPGYLTDAARNTKISDNDQEVAYLSGKYTVRDVMCAFCLDVIGVKYVGAEKEANNYKVGKFLLGQDLLTPAYRSS